MLTKEGCLTRRARLWRAVPADVEWLLVADPRHVHYLANFWVNPLSFSAGERCWLLLERSGEATLLGDNFTIRSGAGEPFVDREVVIDWYDHRHSVINRDHALLKAVQAISERLYGRPGAVEAEWLPVGAWEMLGPDQEAHSVAGEPAEPLAKTGSVDLGSLLRSLRRQKEPDEIDLLRQCMRAGDAGHARAREVIHAGMSEFELYLEVQNAALEALGRPGLVYGDFRAVNAAHPKRGGLPTDYRMQPGDLMILDYSVVLDGYRCDFTNTLSIGEPSDERRLLFELCEAAMRGGEQALRAGASARHVYTATAKPFHDAGYADKFPHHAGHGIGLAHPEPPILVPESDDTLLAGDVVTLEPGLYIEGTGGVRIEHNYLITNQGYERLSNHVIALT